MAETPAAVAQNPAAPADERYDATVHAHRSELARNIMPAEELRPVLDFIAEREFDGMFKASTNVIKGPWDKKGPAPGRGGGQSVFVDTFQIAAQGQWWDRPGMLGFDSMRAMVDQTPILNAIVLTRIRQVKRFCNVQTDRTKPGFCIEHIDQNVELNEDQQRSIKLLERFITNCGWESDPRARKRLRRDNFPGFMAKSVRDMLTLDANPIETEFKRDRRLGLDGFYAVDGATVRLCTEDGYEGDDEIQALQVIQGTIRHAYTFDDLVYEVRNPRTDVTACGYGYAETEMLIKVVTYLLNTMTYNGSFFDKNAIPRGLMTVFGNYDPGDLTVFRRYWNSMVRGVENAHNLPVLVAKDKESGAEFHEIGGQLNEMAFGKWLSFLTSIACAIYGTAPEEVSMESYSSDKSSLSGSDTQERIVSAKDKGFTPLMSHIEGVFTDYIIRPFSEQYALKFKGLEVDDAKQRFEARKLGQTWNEFRKIEGSDPIKGPLGDMPMNQSFIQTWSAATGIGQPEPQQEDFGDPAAQGGSAPPDAADGEGGDFGSGEGDPDGQDGAEGADGAAAAGGQPDFGKGDPMQKALHDFGLPAIYTFEG
jgi:hypothetical protein